MSNEQVPSDPPAEDNNPGSVRKRSSPRERTLRHMRRLLETAAVGAVGLSSCRMPPPIVCDCLPPPINCDQAGSGEVAQWISASAQWVGADRSAGVYVTLNITAPAVTGLTFSGPPTVDNSTLVQPTVSASSLTFWVIPAEGATTAGASVPVQCSTGSTTVFLTFDVSGPPAAGRTVPVTVGPGQ